MTLLKPWDDAQKTAWAARQKPVRSYEDIVLTRLRALPAHTFSVTQYGALSHDPGRYPLMSVTVGDLHNNKPNIVVTGGVHGYEQSGVLGALEIIDRAPKLTMDFNFLVVPCVSPWAMEMNHRWTKAALDTNRHFRRDGVQAEECVAYMDHIDSLDAVFEADGDLHETNERDIALEKERCERDGEEYADEAIPPGFYLVMHPRNEGSDAGPRIIQHVARVTEISRQADIFGCENKGGVIYPPIKGTRMEFGLNHAPFAVTTEVNPDEISQDEAIRAQIACVEGLMDCVLSRG